MARAARPRLHLTPSPSHAVYAPTIPAARFSWTKFGAITGLISFCFATWAALFGAVSALV
jgi:hypothetical protein